MAKHAATRSATKLTGTITVAGLKNRSPTKGDAEMGNRLKLRRIEVGMSQEELGKKLGVSFQQIQKYEKGMNRLGASRLEQVAKALEVPITFFFEANRNAREVETLLAIDAHFSIRLLRAYTSVKDAAVRRKFVDLIESFAESAA